MTRDGDEPFCAGCEASERDLQLLCAGPCQGQDQKECDGTVPQSGAAL